MTEFLTFTSSDKNIQGTVFVRNPIPSFLRTINPVRGQRWWGKLPKSTTFHYFRLNQGGEKRRTHDQKIWLTWAADTRSMLNIQSCHRLWPLGQWWTGGYTVAVRDSVYTISNRLTLTVWSSYWWWERDKW